MNKIKAIFLIAATMTVACTYGMVVEELVVDPKNPTIVEDNLVVSNLTIATGEVYANPLELPDTGCIKIYSNGGVVPCVTTSNITFGVIGKLDISGLEASVSGRAFKIFNFTKCDYGPSGWTGKSKDLRIKARLEKRSDGIYMTLSALNSTFTLR